MGGVIAAGMPRGREHHPPGGGAKSATVPCFLGGEGGVRNGGALTQFSWGMGAGRPKKGGSPGVPFPKVQKKRGW